MSDTRASLIARIKALQAKTVSNGCTEAEALSAAALVARLIDAHGFSTADLDVDDREPITQDSYFFPGKQLGAVSFLANTIASYCDVKVWANRREGRACIVYFGRETDVACAQYLTHLLHTAFASEWERYQRTKEYSLLVADTHGRTLRSSFEVGMVNRLIERLKAMKSDRNQAVDPAGSGRTGQSLVVVKNQEVAKAFAQLGLRLGNSGRKKSATSRAGYQAGQAAGSRVQINPGLGGQKTLRITAS